MLEFYEAYQDYTYLMDFTEKLFREVAQKVLGTHRRSPIRARDSIWASRSTA